MNWAGFEVTFPSGRDVLIKVSYAMNTYSESIQNLEYILETGAGWKGPIQKGIIVFRFPYAIEDNILKGTTPGYRIQHNEISWTFENLEPTRESNIAISYVAPKERAIIDNSKQRIQQNKSDVNAWLQLMHTYVNIAHYHGPNVRSYYFYQKAYETMSKAILLNPYNDDLYASAADLTWFDCCYYVLTSQKAVLETVQYLDKALQIDSKNELALEILSQVKYALPDFVYTLPPTFTPTLTLTPTITLTPTVTETKEPTSTLKPTITSTKAPTNTGTPIEPVTQTSEITKTIESATQVHGISTEENIIYQIYLMIGLIALFCVVALVYAIRNKNHK